MAETERHARLFRNGRNQALRIPCEFELEGYDAILRKEGDRLIIQPVRKGRLSALEILPLEPHLDQRYAEVRHHLATQAIPVGSNDLLIAAHTLAADLTLVTDNTRGFQQIPSLSVENWLLT